MNTCLNARLQKHRRYTPREVQWRRYISQRLEMGAAAAAMFLAGLCWGWLLAMAHIHQWPSGPLLGWLTLPILGLIGGGAWVAAVHWSTGWDEAWGPRLTEARLSLSEEGRAWLETWCKDGRALLVRDLRQLEHADRLASQARS